MKRFTAEEIAIIYNMWINYVSVEAIAEWAGRSVGTIKQAAFRFDFPNRCGRVSRYLKRAPDHIRSVLFVDGEDAFLAAMTEYDREQAAKIEAQKQRKKTAKLIVQTSLVRKAKKAIEGGADRNEEIRKLRNAGLFLEAISVHFGVTRERVRQICASDQRHRQTKFDKYARAYEQAWAEYLP